ncbi:hypothetical protein EDC57_2131 [Inmirania thermothiophila]|uniref:Uncharacterized protein n=1 Tax=Inmirania thermothiophila TaxID=1750597 RepID=A0A3N1Y281_9GAMM|nr:hypothetical protein EDC57_2131 [Inmirania thermothiophila]
MLAGTLLAGCAGVGGAGAGGGPLVPLATFGGADAVRLGLRYPTEAAGNLSAVFAYDARSRRIVALDPFRSEAEVVKVPDLVPVTDLWYTGSETLYLAEPTRSRVRRIDRRGRVERVYSAPAELPRPVAVAVEGAGRRVWVADGAFARIGRFDALGMLLETRELPPGAAPTALALDGQGRLLVLDGRRGAVLRAGPDGGWETVLGPGRVPDPVAFAALPGGWLAVAGRDGALHLAEQEPGRRRLPVPALTGVRDLWFSGMVLVAARPLEGEVVLLQWRGP